MNTKHLILAVALATAVAACSKPAPENAAPPPGPAAEGAGAPPPGPGPGGEHGPGHGPKHGPAWASPSAEPVQATSGTYALDPTHTDVLVQWSHFGFSQPSAHFGIAEGTLVYDAADVGKSSVEVTLPVTGIDTFVPKLDEHLKAADFFDAAKFPNATFKSTKVESVGPNRLAVTGDLTVKDVTKPVTLHVTLNGAGEHPMTKKQAIGFSAEGIIKRSDFGVGAFAPNVSDEVELRITAEGTLADAAAEAPAETPAAETK